MKVEIKIPGYLQQKANGTAVAEVRGRTVRECIHALARQYPGLDGEILDRQGMLVLRWMVYVNGKPAPPSGELEEPVRDGDTIKLLPLVDGG